MESFKKRFLRENRTWTDNILLSYLLAYMWMNVGVLISIITRIAKTCDLFTSDPDVATFMGTYSDFFGIWPAFIFAILIFKGNRPMMKLFLPDKKSRIFTGWAIGIAVGFVMNSINVVGSILLGNLKLSFNAIEILPLIGFAFFVFIQSGAEEIIDRVFIYEKLRRRYKSPWVAVIGNAMFFMILHLGNDNLNIPSLLELFLWGVLFALVILYFDNLWISMAIHASWNFTQNILYGLPNSGIVSAYSVFKIDAAADDFFFDTGFGVEGSWGAVIVITIIIAALIFKFRSYERNDLWDGWVDPFAKKKDKKTNAAVEQTAQ